MVEPARVLITGAAGQIGYVLSHWIASGELYGERPVILHLFDIPVAQNRLTALTMELQDCAFPHLAGYVATTEPEQAFKDIDCAFLVASVPMKSGQIRSDLIGSNSIIFKNTGEWLSQYAKPTVKVLVIGNPDNTNAEIALLHAKNLKPENFSSLSLLDQNRAYHAIAEKLGVKVTDLHDIVVWGNHGESMVADLTQATFEKDGKIQKVTDVLDEKYREETFFKFISHRGWDIVEYRGFSSAASPTKASIQHMKAWLFGTKPGEVLSMGIPVPENNKYGLKPGVVFSLPCTVDKDGNVHVVETYKVNDWLREKLEFTEKDLFNEKEIALHTLGEIINLYH
ncbi:lactate dehydrogenase family protein [Trichomonas vaginalis G3]|uniref:malate dehydrogenase n=2 Tax=Trichomonas vaginalis (strain ATCC PRA-98 / G3) TaxID=412133 RepID=A2G340_TRIV3|nr:malate dehydrogenase family [Trichomonas vaginalis G3]EAX88420.1 lactate dehydrogenase family protein [Trichomonas vaginalis G3]KAI5505342.1 malate dehydrogenase family [Trichomonas vaginalis G3]|eukprot:XP_001301350.1 lactate dehydrogenase family protein [Trichomonas vaginalis G3]